MPIAIRHINTMHRPRSSPAIRDFGFEFYPVAFQYFFDVRQDHLKGFLPYNFNDRLAAKFLRWPTKRLGIGPTYESIAQIASAASKHEWGAIDNRFQFRLLRAQRFFRRFAFAQIDDCGLIEQCAVSLRRSDRSAQKHRFNLFTLSALQ